MFGVGLSLGEQGQEGGLEQQEILRGATADGFQIGSGLIQRQRQAIHRRHNRARGRFFLWGTARFIPTSPAQQELQSFLRRQRFQLQQVGDEIEGLFARGQQQGTLLNWWQKRFEQPDLLDIIEDEQPVVMLTEPVQDGSDDALLLGVVLFGEIEQFSQGEKAREEAFGGLGGDPENGGVCAGVAGGGFGGGLR